MTNDYVICVRALRRTTWTKMSLPPYPRERIDSDSHHPLSPVLAESPRFPHPAFCFLAVGFPFRLPFHLSLIRSSHFLFSRITRPPWVQPPLALSSLCFRNLTLTSHLKNRGFLYYSSTKKALHSHECKGRKDTCHQFRAGREGEAPAIVGG